MPKNISPESTRIFIVAVFENSLAGGRVEILMRFSLRYKMKYHDAASIKYATRYIFKWTGNDRGLMLLRGHSGEYGREYEACHKSLAEFS